MRSESAISGHQRRANDWPAVVSFGKGGKPKLKQIILICASLVLAAPAVRESRGQRWIKDLAGKISYSAVEQSSLIRENYIDPLNH